MTPYTMAGYHTIPDSIKSQADYILENRGLLRLLAEYGEVNFTGSYRLDLMMKRDLDISLVAENISTGEFFSLGTELSILLKPHSMYYRNTKVKHVENRPSDGLYWGIQFDNWNLDIWAINRKEFERSELYIDGILSLLNRENRDIILNLKYDLLSGTDYGKIFSSKELYDSVLNHGVKTADDFYRYLAKGHLISRK